MQQKIRKASRAVQKNIARAQADPWHPRYHFAPPANWMNDPNGTIFFNDEYHLFYQFNPASPKWGNLHWGHARSRDLVHWEHLPVALAPDGFPKELHCWSGCCLISEEGTPTIFYTSMNPRSLLSPARRYAQQWVATGSPDLLSWQKHPDNPILREEIHGEKIPEHWRDPYVWKEDDRWLLVLCGQYKGENFGRVFLYQSKNLFDWQVVGELSRGTSAQGRGWECPNYFKLGDKYVLVVSPYGPVIYTVGDFDGLQHHSQVWHILDHGTDFYATNTYMDDQGRTIMVGWIKAKGDGWSGCLSLPRLLELDADHQLKIKPLPELEQLRGAHQHFERDFEILTESAGTAPLFGERLEIKARFQMRQADSFGFTFIDDDGDYPLTFDFHSHRLWMGDQQADLQFTRGEDLIELHIFVDHAVIEIFVNQWEVFTMTFYPNLAENHALKIAPFIKNGLGKFQMDVWKLNPAKITGIV
jgi:beta-fructofuranosidase